MRDLIYREDAKDFVRHAWSKGLNPIEYIDEIPAADVMERKKGKWVYSSNGTGWRCSECNSQAPFWCMASTQNASNFCPNCGADMRPTQSNDSNALDALNKEDTDFCKRVINSENLTPTIIPADPGGASPSPTEEGGE